MDTKSNCKRKGIERMDKKKERGIDCEFQSNMEQFKQTIYPNRVKKEKPSPRARVLYYTG